MTASQLQIIEMTPIESEFAEAIARIEKETWQELLGIRPRPKCKLRCHNPAHIFPDGSLSTMCSMHTAQEMTALFYRIMGER